MHNDLPSVDNHAGLILVIAGNVPCQAAAITTEERFVLTFDPHLTSANYFAEYDKVWWRTVGQTAGWMDEYIIRYPQGPIWNALGGLIFAACSTGLCRQVFPHGDLVDESCTENLADYLELKEIVISY